MNRATIYSLDELLNVPLVSLNFPEEISSFSHSIVFLYFSALITEEGFLISPCYSLELLHSNVYIFFFLLCVLLLFFSQLFVRPPQTAILPFCISFSWRWSWLITASCTVSRTSLHSSWGALSDLIPWICLSWHACLFAYIPSPLPETLEILFISFWKRSLVHFISFNYSVYQRILTSLTNSHFTPWWEVHSSNLFLIFFPLC